MSFPVFYITNKGIQVQRFCQFAQILPDNVMRARIGTSPIAQEHDGMDVRITVLRLLSPNPGKIVANKFGSIPAYHDNNEYDNKVTNL
jgi:hypothetical protein